MTIKTVGIIGAGTMGNGIAQACAVAGFAVVMVDVSDAAVGRGMATISASLERLTAGGASLPPVLRRSYVPPGCHPRLALHALRAAH